MIRLMIMGLTHWRIHSDNLRCAKNKPNPPPNFVFPPPRPQKSGLPQTLHEPRRAKRTLLTLEHTMHDDESIWRTFRTYRVLGRGFKSVTRDFLPPRPQASQPVATEVNSGKSRGKPCPWHTGGQLFSRIAIDQEMKVGNGWQQHTKNLNCTVGSRVHGTRWPGSHFAESKQIKN